MQIMKDHERMKPVTSNISCFLLLESECRVIGEACEKESGVRGGQGTQESTLRSLSIT